MQICIFFSVSMVKSLLCISIISIKFNCSPYNFLSNVANIQTNITENIISLSEIVIRQKCIIQICSGITRGRVFIGELYAQRFHKFIYLHLITKLFHEDLSSIVSTLSSTVVFSQRCTCLIHSYIWEGLDLSSYETAFIHLCTD